MYSIPLSAYYALLALILTITSMATCTMNQREVLNPNYYAIIQKWPSRFVLYLFSMERTPQLMRAQWLHPYGHMLAGRGEPQALLRKCTRKSVWPMSVQQGLWTASSYSLTRCVHAFMPSIHSIYYAVSTQLLRPKGHPQDSYRTH